jgi:hypothetical protein
MNQVPPISDQVITTDDFMKKKSMLLRFVALGWLADFTAFGQGTLIYDQSSFTNEPVPPGQVQYIEINQPFGQSFIPSFSEVGFLRLWLSDPGGSIPATVYVNLREDSIIGNSIGTTAAITLPGGYGGYTNLFFSTPAPVTPGITYYFQLSAPSSDNWTTEVVGSSHYANGSAFYNGDPALNYNLWFREGEVVPEPSPALLFATGWGALVFQLFFGRKSKPKN